MAGRLERILYVEDDAHIAELAVLAMEEFGGLTILHCPSGLEALEAFSEFSPQLVVRDVMRPGMDGPQTLQRIRETPEGKNVPAVFMTAKVQTHEQQSYHDLGAIGVIAKPFDPIAISDQLQELWEAACAATDHKIAD